MIKQILPTTLIMLFSAGGVWSQTTIDDRSPLSRDHSVAVLNSPQPFDNGVLLAGKLRNGASAFLRFEFLSDRSIRIRVRLDNQFQATLPEKDGFITSNWSRVAFKSTEQGGQIELQTGGLRVVVKRQPFRLSFYRDLKLLADTIEIDSVRLDSQQGWVAFNSPPDERFLGFGDQGSGHERVFPPDRAPLDHRGQLLQMAGLSSERHYYVPFFLSSQGYGFFLNTLPLSVWDMASSCADRLSILVNEPQLDFTLIAGPSFKDVLSEYCRMVGQPPLPPRALLGQVATPELFGVKVDGKILDSGFDVRWFSQKEIQAQAREIRERRRPVNVFLLDSAWQTVRNSFEWVKEIPDPKGMLDLLNGLSFKVVLWQRPTPVRGDYSLYQTAEKLGYLVKGPDGKTFICPTKYSGPSAMVDFTNPEAVRWWQEQVEVLVRMGASSFKLDSASSGFIAAYPEALETQFHNGLTGKQLDNYYGALYVKTVWDALKHALNGKRAVLYTYHQTYFAGGRYPMMALGDRTRQSSQEARLRYALNYGLSGIPFWHGGAFGAFGLPLVDPELKVRLAPYTYNCWREAHEKGLPPLRAMCLEYQDDSQAYEADEQFLYGKDLLVAPVMEGSRHFRRVHLPEGLSRATREGHFSSTGEEDFQQVYLPEGEWIDYWSSKRYRGPGWRYLQAPDTPLTAKEHVREGEGPEYMQPDQGDAVLLVRGGAIIPLAPEMDFVGQKPLNRLTLAFYPNGRSTFTLYEDDGETYAYESGAFAGTKFSCVESGEGVQIEIDSSQGGYVGQPPEREYILEVNGTTKPRSAKANSLSLPECQTEDAWSKGGPGFWYQMKNGEKRTIRIRLPKVAKTDKMSVFLEGAKPVRYYR
jgi:alpha-glucosidase (family GH31 glycosyl hydrolase)